MSVPILPQCRQSCRKMHVGLMSGFLIWANLCGDAAMESGCLEDRFYLPERHRLQRLSSRTVVLDVILKDARGDLTGGCHGVVSDIKAIDDVKIDADIRQIHL